MSIPYLSDEWFAAALEAAGRGASGRPGLGARLQFEAGGVSDPVRWAQVIVDGRIVEWRRGELDDADLDVRMALNHAWRLDRGETDGTGALVGLTVVEATADGAVTTPPAPMDLGGRPELTDLPPVPGATLDVQYEYRSGPWGHVSYGLAFVDGLVDSMVLGRLPEADVTVHATYLQMAQVRRGDIGILDALADRATVQGPEGALALLGGISESPEFHRAELACGSSGILLAALAETQHGAGYAEAMAELMGRTEPPAPTGAASS